jgi:hypothetical protein
MKKTKHNPQLLNEELKKFRLLSEYSFYTEVNSDNPEDNLLLGDLEEADDVPDAANDIAQELDIDAPADDTNPEGGMPPADDTNPAAAEEPTDIQPTQPEPTPPPAGEEDVEIDVTQLVNNTDEAKAAAEQAAQAANASTQMLLQKLADLEARLGNMDNVSAKIDDIEREIVKRNPTDEEKLSLRSLSSYPYSQKLTDYWAEKTGKYDAMGIEDENKEYVLTQDDVDADYSDSDIKKTFSVKQDYEEEDI